MHKHLRTVVVTAAALAVTAGLATAQPAHAATAHVIPGTMVVTTSNVQWSSGPRYQVNGYSTTERYYGLKQCYYTAAQTHRTAVNPNTFSARHDTYACWNLVYSRDFKHMYVGVFTAARVYTTRTEVTDW